MKIIKKAGSTDQTILVFVPDSSSTTGAGLSGLVFNTSGLVCYYVRPGSAPAALTLATQTVTGAHADGGFVEVDATNMPGWYRLDLSDTIIAAGVDLVGLVLRGATNMGPCNVEIQLSAVDLDDATDFGLTALDSLTAPGTAGGLVRGQDTDSLEDVRAIVMNALIADFTTTGSLSVFISAIKDLADKLETALEADGATGYQYTTLALENAPGGGGSTDVNVVNVNGIAVSGPDDLKADLTTVESNQTIINDNVLQSISDIGDLNDFDPETDILEGTRSYAFLLRAGLAVLLGRTNTDKTIFYRLDGTTPGVTFDMTGDYRSGVVIDGAL